MDKKCYIPVKGIDDEIAKKVQGWTPQRVANLRGLYEEKYGELISSEMKPSSIFKLIYSDLVLKDDRFGFNEGKVSTTSSKLKDLMNNTKESSYVTISKIFEALDNGNYSIRMNNDYNSKSVFTVGVTNNIINISFNPNIYEYEAKKGYDRILHIFTHELVHTTTSNAINNYISNTASKEEKQFTLDMWNIMSDLNDNHNYFIDFGKNLNTPEGRASHIKEFIAEVMSNPSIQQDLAKIKSDKSTIWDKIMSLFNKLFNTKFGTDITNSYLSDIVKTVYSHVNYIKDNKDNTQKFNSIFNQSSSIKDQMTEGKITETLVKFSKELRQEDAKKHNDFLNNPIIAYNQLKKNFTAEERYNRVNMLSTMFSAIVDAIQDANPELDRKLIITGFTQDGNTIAGAANIFNEVYNILQESYNEAIEDGDILIIKKYQNIFDNWGALLAFAKDKIKDIEGVKIGLKINYVDETNSTNYDTDNLSNKFIMEESKRESWQDKSDQHSSFGSVGQQVRKIISRVPVYKNGEVLEDDLGIQIMQDPVKVHQELLEYLKGMTSESHMMDILTDLQNKIDWIEPFLEELQNPTIKTQFFNDFKKNFQLYGMQTEKKVDGLKSYKTSILNKSKGDNLFKSFYASIRLGKVINSKEGIFKKVGLTTEVNPLIVENLKSNIIDNLAISSKDKEDYDKKLKAHNESPLLNPKPKKPKTKFDDLSNIERKLFLIDSLETLNIPIDGDTLDRILLSSKSINIITKQLLEIAEFGLNLTKEEKEGTKKISYSNLVNKASSTESKGVLRQKITKILAVLNRFKQNLQVESRVRFQDNTFFSHVIPSFMGDRFDLIESFVRNLDIKGLQKMISNTYLNSSYFNYEGKILNKWLEELYNSDLSKENSFANNFTYKRFLGAEDLNFENFTSKQHAIEMMNEYFSEGQISEDSNYAWYPVFILGDSGVSKYIKAKKYNRETIIDGLYNVYIQESRRMALTKAANTKMESQNIKVIDNFSKKDNEFSILTFLNDPKYYNKISENILEQSVKDVISEYLTDAINEFKNNLDKLGVLEQVNAQSVHFNKELKGNKTIEQVIEDYYINTKFATIQQIQIMTIDPAFYSNTKDLQKRYKEIHAPGSSVSIEAINPYTGKRYSEDGIERVLYFDDIDVNAEVINSEFMEALANQFGKDSKIYNTYKRNTLTDGQGYRTLESYKKVMGMAGQWNPKMEEAYNKIQEIRSKIRQDENVSAEDIKALNDLAVVFQPIKPYLYGFENYNINDSEVLKIPVQHKYAEAVLIPELLPAGSKLRDIAYWMEDHINPETGKREPIDMIGSTKIVKVGGFGSTDISKASSKESLNTALSSGYIHQLSYNDYRIQTNVPEHINSSQLFGTQIRKLIMAGINKAKDYSHYINGNRVNLGGKYKNVKLNGINLNRFYNALITSNILESYHLFENSIDNKEKISDILSQSIINNSRESKDNLLAVSLDENGDFIIPLMEGGLEHDSSALLFSLFKKMVNKQAIKGGSAVQVSAMGIKGYEEAGDLKYVIDPNNSSNILYAECEIPWDLSYTDTNGLEHSLDYNTWCNEDGTLKTDEDGNTLIEKQYPNILDILAYRIPTEREYSMINLKVKRFSHKMAGGTIKVPAQGTTIAGFDFDVDKLYFMKNEYQFSEIKDKELERAWKDFYKENEDLYKELLALRKADEGVGSLLSSLLNIEESDKNRLYKYKEGVTDQFNEWLSSRIDKYSSLEQYDFSKSPLDNSRVSRNNMLIHLIKSRLEDVETFKNRYTPGGFALASKAARLMRELIFNNNKSFINSNKTINLEKLREYVESGVKDPEPNYDFSDPMTIILYNQQNNVAGKLIGIFANQNTNHAFASLMQTFTLKDSISFAGKSYSNLLENKDIDTSLTVAEFLSASVDAVKDPVLNFLNLNTITADAGAVLARLGYNTEDIGLLFNQPIIKEICEYSFNNSMSNIDSVINTVLNDYKVKGELNKAIPDVDFSKERLAYNIVESINSNRQELLQDNTYVSRQIQIAELFKSILEVSNDVSQFVRNTKFTASNAVGSTFGEMYSQQMKVAKYIESFNKENIQSLKVIIRVTDDIYSPLNNREDILYSNDQEYLESLIENPLAYEQAMFDMNRKALKSLNRFYPYNTNNYKNVRHILSSFSNSQILDADTINSIHSDLMVYMLGLQENSLFNGSFPYKETSTKEYFTKVFPEELFNLLESNPSLKAMPIFQYMQFQIDEDTDIVSMNIQDIGGLASYRKDEIKESWADLLNNKETSELAQSLFMYNYYKLGFTFSPLAFMNLAPTEVKLSIKVGKDYEGNDLSYIDFLNIIQKEEIQINALDFSKKYVLNHLDNNKLVFYPKGNSKKILDKVIYKDGVAQSNFTLNITALGNDSKPFLLPGSNNKICYFKPFLVIDDVVYISNGEFGFNSSTNGTMEYIQINPLGIPKKSINYTSDSEYNINNIQKTTIVETTKEFTPEINQVENISIDVDTLINEAVELAMQVDSTIEIEPAIEMLKKTSREDLIDTIEYLKLQVKELKDQEGNKIC